MRRHKWRHFRPRFTRRKVTISPPQNSEDTFSAAWKLVATATRDFDVRRNDLGQLSKAIDSLKHSEPSAALYVALLLLQTPRAAWAQQQMDNHRGGYHNRHERLFELIDYNDCFVNAVLALEHRELASFVEKLRRASHEFCRQVHAANFTDEQYEAIVRGLSREIAVYLTAHQIGYRASMSSRQDDAFGIDMVLENEMGVKINIDCKTPSAFRHRLEDLLHEGRIKEHELLEADERDYLIHIHRRDGSHSEKIPVVLLCVRPERVGDIVAFELEQPNALKILLEDIAHKLQKRYTQL